ncbi:hypothetical protein XH87_08975 [Bradyrhizobium sp. CCBAU 53415]|nr:hypothetical protein [Bradyrhizobium sp. CCBAU 53415]
MAGDALALVKEFDRPIVDAGIDQLADQTVRRGVPVAVDLDMIVGSDPAALPACEGIDEEIRSIAARSAAGREVHH